MTVNSSRPQTESLFEGATDGRYRKARPDTQVVMLDADAKIKEDRSTLNPFMNYGYITQQSTTMVNPGA
jgi:hypothetical protein